MTKHSIRNLNAVSQTLLIPLYFRALESQRPDALVRDPKAVELVGQLDCLGISYQCIGALALHRPKIQWYQERLGDCVQVADGMCGHLALLLHERIWRPIINYTALHDEVNKQTFPYQPLL